MCSNARHCRRIAAVLALRGHAPNIVAAQIKQHQVLRTFLVIRKQFRFQRQILFRGCPARPGAGDWTDGDLAVTQPD